MILNQKQRKILMDNKELKKFVSNQAKCILKLGKKSSGGKRNIRSKKNRSTKKKGKHEETIEEVVWNDGVYCFLCANSSNHVSWCMCNRNGWILRCFCLFAHTESNT